MSSKKNYILSAGFYIDDYDRVEVKPDMRGYSVLTVINNLKKVQCLSLNWANIMIVCPERKL